MISNCYNEKLVVDFLWKTIIIKFSKKKTKKTYAKHQVETFTKLFFFNIKKNLNFVNKINKNKNSVILNYLIQKQILDKWTKN